MNKTLSLTLITSFSVCAHVLAQYQLAHTPQHLGCINAKAVKPEIYKSYLTCYALDNATKKECTDKLAEKYIEKQWQQNQEYVESFQFEAEKLGFKKFLNNHNLSCESIDEGPLFIN